MALIDWAIVIILIVSVLSAAKHGFFVEAFSLAGVILGLLLACWNYQKILPWMNGWVHSPGVAEAIAFVAIAIAVMVIAGLAGRLIRWSVRSIGLGWADRFVGAIFGLLKGCVLVTLGVMAIAAFLPQATWLERSRIAPYFLSVAHKASVVTPAQLGERIREGVKMIRDAQPDWLKPNAAIHSGPLQQNQKKPGTYPA
ncbi:CvpA family protein [Alloacidobacterium dinghuense]|uniref:CvpA family protein n=1 Tax=Alloacidobacterium dinghuense TaxID=2763107 RepID=A0A7G8BMZ4_9BACT|nr:CvpA family protein [Alloacidobacterium dinghuense]QNI33914.1 CvpA family protein [Alloacidobacterium dinghuense]